ncbi:MAG TPA: phosphoribosylamine--glycine ligase, partial [Chloroflexota bacterium]|nr:phosphoribosylamine--glycine ligase [Chloroflexota bacterium]
MSALNVLVVGGGAREHALAWKLRQSSGLGRLFCAPGNAGTAAVAEAVPIAANQVDALADWSAANDIGLVVVGPEEPLALGLADRLRTRGIPVLGPGAAGARIESSKSWAKEIMRAAGVPTAAHATFSSAAEALEYVRHQCFPLVIKADGLAAGKGVVIARSAEEARRAIVAALEERVFGEAGQTIVIEEYLEGEEMSLIAFVSDRVVVPLLPARDHKAVGDGDTGPNTGGMGAIAPARAAGHDDAQTLCRAL